jgi:O-antigen/teichoic acid export membrane protein
MTLNRSDRDRSSLADMLVSGGGALIAPVINIVSIPIVMRLYSPYDYGIWGLLLSIAFLFGQISTLRYELAIVVERDDARAGQVITISLLAVVAMTLISAMAARILPSLLSGASWQQTLGPRLWALPAIVAAMGLKLIADGWAVRARCFTLRAVGLVVLAAGTNTAQIGLWYAGVTGADGLILGTLFGFILSGIVQLTRLVIYNGARIKPLRLWRGLGGVARDHRRFVLYTMPYTLLNNLRREGLKVITGLWGSEAVVGYVATSWRLTYFPAQACSNGIRPVIFERAAREAERADLWPFITRVQRWLAFVVAPAVIVFEIFAEEIIVFAVGENWLPMVTMARLLAVPASLFVMTNWLDRVFDVLGRQDLAFRLELIFSLLSLGALAAGLWWLNDLHTAIAMMSGALLLYYLATIMTVRALLRKEEVHDG